MDSDSQKVSSPFAVSAPGVESPAPLETDSKVPDQSAGADQSQPQSVFVSSEDNQSQNLNDRQPQTGFPSVVTQKPKGFSKFFIFIVVLLLVVATIWFGVGYIYLQNKNIKKDVADNLSDESLTPALVPTPIFSPRQIKIVNGSIIRDIPSGEIVTLISKDDYPSTGITGFMKVAVSPDEKSMCFESWPPVLKPALYIAKIDGSNVKEISPDRRNCVWSSDNKYLIYINEPSSVLNTDIYAYDVSASMENNLTESYAGKGSARKFEIIGLSADGSKVVCVYYDVTANVSEVIKNDCEIDLKTLKVKTDSTESENNTILTPSPS